MARTSKSLLNKTSTTKTKKVVDKYSEVSESVKKEYKYQLKDTVVYLGIVEDYKGSSCLITKRSSRKNTHYYSVEFEDSSSLDSISEVFLKTEEEYNEWLLEQENNNGEANQFEMTEFEIELNKRGLESHKNYAQCLNPVNYYHMDCTGCRYNDRCVYVKKGKYKKID